MAIIGLHALIIDSHLEDVRTAKFHETVCLSSTEYKACERLSKIVRYCHETWSQTNSMKSTHSVYVDELDTRC